MNETLMCPMTRRFMLQSTATGFGALAFAALTQDHAVRANAPENSDNPLPPKPTHFPAKAKRVIFLCMEGGPSHVDTFDYKPKLIEDSGTSYTHGRMTGTKLWAPLWPFKQHGESGHWISSLFPEVAAHADDICMLHGMQTDLPAHPQAYLQMHCGVFQAPRPSLGSWTLFGLGSENANLPGFITLAPPIHNGGPANYGNSFLPAICRGTKIGSDFQVNNLKNSRWPEDVQRLQLDYVQQLNRAALGNCGDLQGVEGMIESNKLAFRMQLEMPKFLNLADENEQTKKLYGLDSDRTKQFGGQCLLARRFIESGVRFVEITSASWDYHRDLKGSMERICGSVDKPIAGLLTDLKQRGLLKDTLVIWGGEFGRTPTAQNADGRDHNNKGYTIWMAGGGVKAGLSYGQTDEYGFEAVQDAVHVHDWHATILHLLGLDHKKLTYRYAGREMRLTDVKGNVVSKIIA